MHTVPPTEFMFDGPQDVEIFRANGEEFLQYYIDICKLQPDESILDVGCGIGRKTIPLTTYLSEHGSYTGFDCVETGIQWCKENITAKYPNFQFEYIDIYSPGYNPTGVIKLIDLVFPYADRSFDLIVLGSVFTHMLYEDIRHYLKEIARVMKNSGRCLITYFITGVNNPSLSYRHEHGWMADDNFPEQAIGYDEEILADLYSEADLHVEKVIYGSWSGNTEGLSYQDMILAKKY